MSDRRRRVILVTILPLVLGAVFVLQYALVGAPRTGGKPAPLAHLPGLAFPWMLFSLLAPAVFLLVERRPLTSENWRRRLPLHAAAALAFAAVHLALATTLHLMVYAPPDLGWAGFYRNNLYAFLTADVVQYVLLAGASHALLFHGRLRGRELAASKLEAHLAEARLEALSNQLRPHFLFNTLNTVRALARRGDGRAVERVVSDLGELLRASLDRTGGQLVPALEEMAHLERYVAIQRVRYRDRLDARIHVEPRAGRAAVPTMILQPLVENAIKHGLARRRGSLRVRVRLAVDHASLQIEVADDGPGFPEDRDLRRGVGLDNIGRRLQELYGPAHTLHLGASDLGGALVRIRVPLAQGANGPDDSAHRLGRGE